MNEALRSHVTGTAFTLTLGKTHVAALVSLELQLKHNRHLAEAYPRRGRTVLSSFISAVHGLQDRGLIDHHFPDDADRERDAKGRLKDLKPRQVWTITPAGQFVVGLLKESGLYDEYATELFPDVVLEGKAPKPQRRRLRRRAA